LGLIELMITVVWRQNARDRNQLRRPLA